MKRLTREVFEYVENPMDHVEKFQEMSKVNQLKWLNAYKEYALENKVYAVVMNTGKTVNEVFYKNEEIDVYKRDLALARYALLKETGTSSRQYSLALAKTSYVFECENNEDVKTRFEIYRQVKDFPIRHYLSKEAQTSYNFF